MNNAFVEDGPELRPTRSVQNVLSGHPDDLRADRLLAEAYATGGDPLRLAGLFGISDPTAIRYCAETGLRGYDDSQALEGAAGSAGRTESTSAST